jgi:hypothetical protein
MIWSVGAAAEAAGVSERTIYRLAAAFAIVASRGGRSAGDRPNQPQKRSRDRMSAICALRCFQMTAAEIARSRCRHGGPRPFAARRERGTGTVTPGAEAMRRTE